MVTHPASSLAQDRVSSPTETSVLTTMLRRQLTVIKRLNEIRFRPRLRPEPRRDAHYTAETSQSVEGFPSTFATLLEAPLEPHLGASSLDRSTEAFPSFLFYELTTVLSDI